MSYTPLPIGIDDFRKLRLSGYYYVDKSQMIKELLDKKGEVNLFTRPRRFGKTLNISMLKYYFELPYEGETNCQLFDGLKIMDAGEKYTREQEQYPVIMLTLKSAKQPSYEMAYASLVDDIGREYSRHNAVLKSPAISDMDKQKFIMIRDRQAQPIDYAKSLLFLSQCLQSCYGRKTVILIDEYDVPLENAYYNGFYDEMIAFIRSLFESALKTNPFLEFGVITGCLRISKESIFTGLNNLEIISILNKDYSEHFGFTEDEVRAMLSFYHREEQMQTMKEWYDGYRFGNTEVYNPWSVINFAKALYSDKDAFPTAAWSNSSSNNIVRDLIQHADDDAKEEIEALIAGGSIRKQIHEDITYEDIYQSQDNLWNFLFFTGYLKQLKTEMVEEDIYATFGIPNREVRKVYKNMIANWFRDEVKLQDMTSLYHAMLEADAEAFQDELEEQLMRTISYMDSKEAFYHGFLLGLLQQLKGYRVKSNREAGLGRYDVCIYSLNVRKPVILMEFKLAEKYPALDAACDEALKQIGEKMYAMALEDEGYTQTICYGIGFFKKQLKVKVEKKAVK